MIRKLLAALLLAGVLCAGAPVQEATGTATTGTTVSVTMGSAPSGSNILIATIGVTSNKSVSALSGATWTKIVSSSQVNSSDGEIWCGTSPTGATGITVTIASLGGARASVNVAEWSGYTCTTDGTNSHDAQSGTVTTNSVTTANASDLLLAVVGIGAASFTSGPTNSFVALSTPASTQFQAAYEVVSSTGAYSSGWTFGGTPKYSAEIAALKAASAGINYTGSYSEIILASNSQTGLGAHFAGASDSLALANIQLGHGAHLGGTSDLALILDVPGGVGAHFAAKSEALSLSNSQSQFAAHIAAPAENLVLSETRTGLGTHYADAADNLIVVDIALALKLKLVAVFEMVGLRDAAASIGSHFGTASDLVTVTNASTSAGSHFGISTDLVGTADLASRFAQHFVSARDMLFTLDLGNAPSGGTSFFAAFMESLTPSQIADGLRVPWNPLVSTGHAIQYPAISRTGSYSKQATGAIYTNPRGASYPKQPTGAIYTNPRKAVVTQ